VILNVLGMAESLVSYEPSPRFLHRLNPITKMAMALVVIIGGMYASFPQFPWVINFGIFVVLSLLAMIGGVPLGKEMRLRGGYILAILMVLFLANLIFARGGEGVPYGIRPVTYFAIEPIIYVTSISVNYALAKTLFILDSIVMVIVFLKSTRLADLSYSMQRVGIPYSVATLIGMTLRCVPMVTGGLLTVYNAQRARGLEMDKGPLGLRLRRWGGLLTPLVLVLMKWVDVMSIVFQSRGLDFSKRRRTRLRLLPFGVADALVTIVSIGGLVAFIVWSRRLL